MANYHYIIAGLPSLVLDYQSGKNFSYQDIRNNIAEMCSVKDIRLIEWLEFGFNEENLCSHIYRAAEKSDDNFIRQYYAFDRSVRNAIAAHNAKELGFETSRYTIGEIPDDFEEISKVRNILSTGDIIEKEKQIDRLRWDKANEITAFNYFDIDVILAFLLKAKIVDRWNSLDKETGSKMFEELVNEVRGTFKGINKEN